MEKEQRVRAIRRSGKLPFFIDKAIWDKVEWVDGDVLDVVALGEAMKDVDPRLRPYHPTRRARVPGTAVELPAALRHDLGKKRRAGARLRCAGEPLLKHGQLHLGSVPQGFGLKRHDLCSFNPALNDARRDRRVEDERCIQPLAHPTD